MLAVWAYIEADFRRDYGIRLVDELSRMSWREFCVLLDGLSPYGSLATNYERLLKEQEANEPKSEDEQRSSADRFWQSVASIA